MTPEQKEKLQSLAYFAQGAGSAIRDHGECASNSFYHLYKSLLDISQENKSREESITDNMGNLTKEETEEDRMLRTDISELELSIRPYNALIADGIHQISDLLKTDWKYICSIPNIGRNSMRQIKYALDKKGITLKYWPFRY